MASDRSPRAASTWAWTSMAAPSAVGSQGSSSNFWPMRKREAIFPASAAKASARSRVLASRAARARKERAAAGSGGWGRGAGGEKKGGGAGGGGGGGGAARPAARDASAAGQIGRSDRPAHAVD